MCVCVCVPVSDGVAHGAGKLADKECVGWCRQALLRLWRETRNQFGLGFSSGFSSGLVARDTSAPVERHVKKETNSKENNNNEQPLAPNGPLSRALK